MQTKFSETGRSMVEMLGVLAVIGVLSVGGIMGYKYGMMKYRVNETINELNIMANTYGIQMQQMIEEQNLSAEGELLSEENAITRMGYGYEVLGFDNHFEIALFDVPNPECEQLQKTGWAMPYEIEISEVTAENCGELVYYINNDLSGLAPEVSSSVEEDTNETETPLNCGLYGTLIDNSCKCDEGYTGNICNQCDSSKGYKRMDYNGKCYLDCEKTSSCTLENFCNGNAFDLYDYGEEYYCLYCNRGYWGVHCENYDSTGDACNGKGVNPYYQNNPYGSGCACKDGYWGTRCENPPTKEVCSGHGIYKYIGCICDDGYSGENCDIEESQPCGVLLNDYGLRSGYFIYENEKRICHCTNGYTGTDCKTPPAT